MKKTITILGMLIFLAINEGVQASVRDEMKALYHPKDVTMPIPLNGDIHPPQMFKLKNGKEINTTDWKIVLFMQGGCTYCQQFDPVLKTLSQKTGIKVFPYTLDGKSDTSFPTAIPATQEVVKTFFEHLPMVTPTTFLINVNSLKTVPILQGATDESRFMSQLDRALARILRGDPRNADVPDKKTRAFIREKRKLVDDSQWFCPISLALAMTAILTSQMAYAFFDIAFKGSLSSELKQANGVGNWLYKLRPESLKRCEG